MISGTTAGEGKRRIRLGMVGGGPGAFIGAVHRIAARMDDHYELVAAALSSDPGRSRAAPKDLPIPPRRTASKPWPSLRRIICTTQWQKLLSRPDFTSSVISP